MSSNTVGELLLRSRKDDFVSHKMSPSNPAAATDETICAALDAAVAEADRHLQIVPSEPPTHQGINSTKDVAVIMCSRGKWHRSPCCYTGVGGIAFMHFELYRVFTASYHGQQEGRKSAAIANAHLQKAYRIVSSIDVFGLGVNEGVAFFCGAPGLHVLSAAIASALGDATTAAAHSDALLRKWAPIAASSQADGVNEMLYGRAGFLWCLRYGIANRLFSHHDADAAAIPVIRCMFEQGYAEVENNRKRSSSDRHRFSTQWPLMWHWHGYYLGGAHGVAGILGELLQWWHLVNDADKSAVVRTLTFIIESYTGRPEQEHLSAEGSGKATVTFESIGLPATEKDPLEVENCSLHFCHGLPGLVPALLTAHRVLAPSPNAPGHPQAAPQATDEDGTRRHPGRQSVFLQAARRCATVMFQRGALLKGHNLCHGILSNAYGLLLLHGATKEAQFRTMARKLFDLAVDDRYVEAVARYDDRTRRVAGMSDMPGSLMEGAAGAALFYADLLLRPASARFPGVGV